MKQPVYTVVGKFIVKSIALIINVFVVLLMFMVLFASKVSPDKILLPAYSTLIFPLVILANIFFVLFWGLARKWLFLLSLSTLIYMMPEITTVVPFHFGSSDITTDSGQVKVLTYNVMLNSMLEKETDKKSNEVIKLIRQQDADIVCLQEFAVSEKDKYLTESDIRKAFRDYPYHNIEYINTNNWRKIGIATFSKYPIVNKQLVDIKSNYHACQYTDIVIKDDTVRVLNIHLESNRLTQKDKSMPAELKDNFNTEKLSGTTRHLSRKLGAAYKVRARQAKIVSQVVKNSPYKLLVCGDFNDLPLSYAYTKVRSDLQDAFASSSSGLGWTFNESVFRFRIDHIFYSSHFTPIECEVVKGKGSDHYPVLAKFKI